MSYQVEKIRRPRHGCRIRQHETSPDKIRGKVKRWSR